MVLHGSKPRVSSVLPINVARAVFQIKQGRRVFEAGDVCEVGWSVCIVGINSVSRDPIVAYGRLYVQVVDDGRSKE